MADTITSMPHSDSNAAQWIAWHQLMRKRYGKDAANVRFAQRWADMGSYEANTHELRTYAKSQGMSIESENIIEDISDSFRGIGSSIGGGFNSIGSMALLGVVIVIAIIGFVIYQAMKN